jgi:superoxide dismutase, Fe-Mn family
VAITQINRRSFFKITALSAATAAAMTMLPATSQAAGLPLSLDLPPLPYAYNALEPWIDEQTMRLHHTRHHQAFVTGLANLAKDYPALRTSSLADILANLGDLPAAIRTAVRNNGGGHMNHSIFWAIMGPGGGGEPSGALAAAIRETYGTTNYMKSLINATGAARFGSGWTWLVTDRSGKLKIRDTPYQDSPFMDGEGPLLGIDVWEHAYYLKYNNRRADYLNAWWNVVNWDAVGKRYETAIG